MLDAPPFLSSSISQAFLFGAMRLGLDPRDLFKHAGLELGLPNPHWMVTYDLP